LFLPAANGATPLTVSARLATENARTMQTEDPILILGKAIIKAFLASDPSKNGRDSVVIRKKIKVKLIVGSNQLRPFTTSPLPQEAIRLSLWLPTHQTYRSRMLT
jgi:hypothetical protein